MPCIRRNRLAARLGIAMQQILNVLRAALAIIGAVCVVGAFVLIGAFIRYNRSMDAKSKADYTNPAFYTNPGRAEREAEEIILSRM